MILQLLRHVSLCLWLALAVTGILSFGTLPLLQPLLGADAAPVLAAGLLAAVLAAVVWAADRLGQRRVRCWMRRADRAERAGLSAEAEKAFQNALAALDSFLLSPSTRRRALLPLAGRMARHYLAEARFSPAAEDFIVRYLGAHPRDEEVAEQWVAHAGRQGGLREEHQELADRLAAAHPRNAAIQRGAARLYLSLERSDYLALQAYRRVCSEDGGVPAEFCTDLARLFQKDGRSDEWARQVQRQARAAAPAPAETRPGKPPEAVRPAGPDELPPGGEIAHPIADEDTAFRMAAVPDAVDEDEEEAGRSLLAGARRRPLRLEGLARWGAGALAAVRDRAPSLDALRDGVWRWTRWGPALRRALMGLLIAGLAAGGGWVALNLAGRLAAPPAGTSAVEISAAPAVPSVDPFALQVAAYLKPDYALKLVEDLKKKGLDAYWVQTASSGKTWYQVRIASFSDPESAREFGRNLKGKGLIDDFYVTSSSR